MLEAVQIRQVPSQRLFNQKAAALYLGMHPHTLQTETEKGNLFAKARGRYKVYTLEELDRFIDDLPIYARGGSSERGVHNGR